MNNNNNNCDDDLIIGSKISKIYSNALSTDYSKNSNNLLRPFSSNSSLSNKNIVKNLNYKKPSNNKIKKTKNYFKLHKKNNISVNIPKYKLNNKNELYLKENLLPNNKKENENQTQKYIKKTFNPIKIDIENDFKKNKYFFKK